MPRKARVASISLGFDSFKPESPEDNVAKVLGVIDQVAPYRPDLIVLPECFHAAGLSRRPADERAVTPEDGVVQTIAERARAMRSLIVCPVHEARDGRVYNTALCLDRKGELAGRYDKIHPTEWELEDGITPGEKAQHLWQTPLGRIGCQICFDVNWPEGWHRYAEQGADLIVWPSAYAGGRPLGAMALATQCFVVSATWPRTCRLFDVTGDLIAGGGRMSDSIVAQIDLERTLFHFDYQQEKLEALRRKYGSDVHVDVYHDEGWFALHSLRDDLTVAAIIREFELLPLRDYLRRASASQDGARRRS